MLLFMGGTLFIGAMLLSPNKSAKPSNCIPQQELVAHLANFSPDLATEATCCAIIPSAVLRPSAGPSIVTTISEISETGPGGTTFSQKLGAIPACCIFSILAGFANAFA